MPDGATNLPATTQQRREVAVVSDDSSFANLLDTAKFEHMWRVAKVFSVSGMVPKHFADKPEACFVALQMAIRLEVDPFMFMQNTYLSPDGKPAMYGQMAIGLVNRRGPFKGPIQYELSGEGDRRQCRAWQHSKTSGDLCEVTVSIAMAKAEGWYNRNPKWRNIPDMMLRYRAGAWLGRVYAPECLMGLPTVEEVQDMGSLEPQPDGTYAPAAAPPRPTRAQFESRADDTAREAAADPAPEPFDFATADGEARTFDAATDAAGAMATALRDAARVGRDALDGIWESNALLITQLRERGEGAAADELKGLYAEMSAELAAAAARKAAEAKPAAATPPDWRKWGTAVTKAVSGCKTPAELAEVLAKVNPNLPGYREWDEKKADDLMELIATTQSVLQNAAADEGRLV